jgi:NTP pyrophosphatase (non-canonical NTP hydrolase)
MMGEAGEVAGAYKKWHRSDLSELSIKDREIIGEEVVDVLVYAFVIAGQLGIDLEATYDRKREFNDARFGRRAREAGSGS